MNSGILIGLPDEYQQESPHFDDKDSIMHTGMGVREHHLDLVETWGESKI